jgi:hypothetical protein
MRFGKECEGGVSRAWFVLLMHKSLSPPTDSQPAIGLEVCKLGGLTPRKAHDATVFSGQESSGTSVSHLAFHFPDWESPRSEVL